MRVVGHGLGFGALIAGQVPLCLHYQRNRRLAELEPVLLGFQRLLGEFPGGYGGFISCSRLLQSDNRVLHIYAYLADGPL